MNPPTPAPLLADEHAAFIQGAVSIVVASRDAHNVPSLGRAAGCRVSADRRRVSVFVAPSQAPQLLADIRACGRVAAVFTRPSTNRALQLKAGDARIRPPTAAERKQVARYVEAFGVEVTPLGYNVEQARTLFRYVEGDLVAVEFTPTAAFEQTPGPAAGAAIGAAS
jgi:hypothetical protein